MSRHFKEESYKNKQVLLRLLKYARPYTLLVILSLLLLGALTVIEIYRPKLLGDAIDIFTNGGDYSEIVRLGVIYLAAVVVQFAFNFANTMVLQYTGQNIIYNIRREVFKHVHSLSMSYFDVTPVGRLVTRVTNDVEALNEMYTSVLVRLVKNIAKIIALAAYMLYLNVNLAVLSFILLPIIFIITFIFKKVTKTIYRITRTKLTAINTYLSEHISGMKSIQIFNREKDKSLEFEERANDYFDASYREMLVYAVFRPAMYLISTIALCLILGAGGYSVLELGLSFGTMYVFTNYIGSFFEPIQELAEQFGTLQQAFASAEKIFTVLDEKAMIKNPEVPVDMPNVKGRIVFDHVWFAYNAEDWVLKDVSFVIEPGKSVAFVGATGAGKTSILSLIGRYYDINKGRITIDGVDVKSVNKDDLRHAIGQVQQDVFLFTGNIMDNITLKSDKISEEIAVKAAKTVNADGFIRKLEKAYEEPVSERGATLSAGQRQLISFARTLAYDPSILVMDEATANIDTETEVLIQEALARLMKGRTTIMVAHRLSTIQHADKIIVLNKGEIIEEGNHQELLAKNGMYKKLYELQLASADNQ